MNMHFSYLSLYTQDLSNASRTSKVYPKIREMPTNTASGSSCAINLIQPSTSTDQKKTACQEYKHESKIDPTTGAIQEIVTIESQDASPFEIVLDVKPTSHSALTNPRSSLVSREMIPQDYYYQFYLDGIGIGKTKQSKLELSMPFNVAKIYSHDYSTSQSLQFAKINLVDPDDYEQDPDQVEDRMCQDEKVIKSLGTIRVDISKCNLTYRSKPLAAKSTHAVKTTNQMKFSERSKKACLSTTAGLAEESVSDRSAPTMEWQITQQDPHPFLQFIFKYKPRSILESEGTISPKKEEVKLVVPAIVESDSEPEIINNQSSSSHNNNNKKKKKEIKPQIIKSENNNNKRIKSEDHLEIKKNLHTDKKIKKEDKKPKIIDLTLSDDDD
ncbi:hypothetical protein Pst134EA_001043 [Puccinia striiformis f. sp. tritici]|uniref:hypothetical protein n=1 Tax=Puccinia striiformis f. sp. tritici TaxID=168172 RepID=UPI0020073906|nr:hypothetical protein Pst134EA_001043 [Puccinia striiformis f. sp. tritici]KAH9473988.1 hypothetical protein Pst134EA_001043 [Puccinia striiformis f. sp. tritici]